MQSAKGTYPARERLRRRAAALALALFGATIACADPAHGQGVYASLSGAVLLDNARVHVERFVLPPGHSTGPRAGGANRLLVYIRGGTLRSNADGRATSWREGRVAWHAASEPGDAGVTNIGADAVDFEWVTLKHVAPAAIGAAPKYRFLNYPNIPGEDLLENDFVIVQRFLVQPGQWEGVHAHHPDMLYIHVHGGQWAARSKREPEHTYPDYSPDGEVGWMATIPLSEGHESGNVGTQPIDLIWVTLKQ